jgi:hypothetical protein
MILAGVFTFVVAIGAVRFVVSTFRQSRNAAAPQFLLLSAAPLFVFLSVVRYSAIALGTDQARLMFPALAAMAVWVGVGLIGLFDWLGGEGMGKKRAAEERDRRVVGVFTAVMATFGLVVLVGLIRPGFAPPKPIGAGSVQAGAPLATFGNGLELLAVELPSESLAAGDSLPVRLIWRAGQPLANDLRPSLRLVHVDGWLAAEWSHSPAGGRYSTDRWLPGEVIADDYLIVPQPATPGAYRVELSVRPFGGDWLPAESQTAAGPNVFLGQVTYH